MSVFVCVHVGAFASRPRSRLRLMAFVAGNPFCNLARSWPTNQLAHMVVGPLSGAESNNQGPADPGTNKSHRLVMNKYCPVLDMEQLFKGFFANCLRNRGMPLNPLALRSLGLRLE